MWERIVTSYINILEKINEHFLMFNLVSFLFEKMNKRESRIKENISKFERAYKKREGTVYGLERMYGSVRESV